MALLVSLWKEEAAAELTDAAASFSSGHRRTLSP